MREGRSPGKGPLGFLLGLGLLALAGLVRAEGSWPQRPPLASLEAEAVRLRCREVVRGLRIQALYWEEGRLLVLLGRERPLLLLAVEEGRPMPHAGPLRGRLVEKRSLPFLGELALARRVVAAGGEYRCFVLHRGRVVGVLRLGEDLEPLPLPGVPPPP
ncbi:hypothetical protein [Thermus caliditerrae]|uniref:hypothetical protein n=1 Tax=Thermus caliditerrae TaxID=1330700 RepID=UPI001F25C2A4|nr:hypothetical protein [Thermus caliditerrae]